MSSKKTSVKVTILGEEYAIRSDASPEHTRAVAEHLDRAVRQILQSGSVIESHRATVLAALQITSELFQARETSGQLSGQMQALAGDVKRLLPPAKREVTGEFEVAVPGSAEG